LVDVAKLVHLQKKRVSSFWDLEVKVRLKDSQDILLKVWDEDQLLNMLVSA